MKESFWLKWLPTGLALLGVALIALWLSGGSGVELQQRRPGADRAGGSTGTNGGPGKWEGKLVKGSAAAPQGFNGVWPWFRGPALNGISTDPVPLARSWPEGGPKAFWKIDVDEGYAAAAIWKGNVYVLDYDTKNQVDALRCLSLADGQELWRYTYPVRIKRFHGRTRTIPALTGQYVVTLGPKCHVLCLDQATGEYRWHKNLVAEFNNEVPEWYAGQCPLIDQGRLILGVGGDALVIAVDVASGKVLWQTPNPRKWAMTHSSLTPIEFKGQRMYVYCASGGVAGVSAEDGRILWETPDWTVKMANIPAPIHLGDGKIFLCGGYGAGSMMIQLQEEGGKFKVATLFRLKPSVFGSEQQTPILYENHLFGVRPKPDEQLVCLDLNGKVVWESGAANKFGSGPYLIAQGLIYVMNNDGLLTLAEASTTAFKKLAQAKVLHGHDSWGPMALADGRLIVRDMTQMICLDAAGK